MRGFTWLRLFFALIALCFSYYWWGWGGFLFSAGLYMTTWMLVMAERGEL